MLTSIPAVAPDAGGTGEEMKKAVALKKFLQELGFSNFTDYYAGPRVPERERPNFPVSLKAKAMNEPFG